MRWLQSARAGTGRAARGRPVPFFARDPPLCSAFSRVSFVYHFTAEGEKGGTSGPLMSDSTRLQRNETRNKRNTADMAGSEITPCSEV
jgi:hypothetical protein